MTITGSQALASGNFPIVLQALYQALKASRVNIQAHVECAAGPPTNGNGMRPGFARGAPPAELMQAIAKAALESKVEQETLHMHP